MPAGAPRPKVVLCATLTADGKLDPAAPAVPPVLYGGDADPARHPWGALYDRAAGVLVSAEVRENLPLPSAAKRTLVTIRPDALSPEAITSVLERSGQEGVAGDWLCFGGAKLFRALLENGLADELRLIVRPKIDGQRGSAALSGVGGGFFPASVVCRLLGLETVGDECFLRYRLLRRAVRARKTA